MFSKLVAVKRLLTGKWAAGLVVAGLVSGMYFYAYERGETAAKVDCSLRIAEARVEAYENARRLALLDRERARRAEEQIRDERERTDSLLGEAARSPVDLPDCGLDDYRLCVARSAALGTGAEDCAELLDPELPESPGAP